jgi:hypothetical protein
MSDGEFRILQDGYSAMSRRVLLQPPSCKEYPPVPLKTGISKILKKPHAVQTLAFDSRGRIPESRAVDGSAAMEKGRVYCHDNDNFGLFSVVLESLTQRCIARDHRPSIDLHK